MRSTTQRGLRVLGLGIAASLVLAACGGDDGGDTASEGGGDGEVVIGLITKTDTNPFFVKMKEGAEAKAEELGAELQSFAGEFDGDNEAQVEAVEQLIAQGAQGILITPSDSAAIVPSLDKAREAGLLVVALDTQTDPPDAADVTFATDNFLAGQLIGQWAKETLGDTPARIAMLDLNPDQVSVDVQRDQGFLDGFGLDIGDETQIGDESPSEVVGHDVTDGSPEGGRTAMENLLQKDPASTSSTRSTSRRPRARTRPSRRRARKARSRSCRSTADARASRACRLAPSARRPCSSRYSWRKRASRQSSTSRRVARSPTPVARSSSTPASR